MERKFWTGDGRKSALGEIAMKEMKKQAEEILFGKKKKGTKNKFERSFGYDTK